MGFRRGFLLQVGSFQMMMMIALITSKISLEREPLLKGLFAQMKLEGDLWSKLDIFATFLKCTSVSLLRCKLVSRSAQTNPQISADFLQTKTFMREFKELRTSRTT